MIAISDIQTNYGNTMALIILCCRIHFKKTEIDNLNPFIGSNHIDWSDYIKTCRKHQISPLIHRIILKTKLPEEIQKKINNELNKYTLQSFEQAKETERLIFLLKEKNIPVIPYKGTSFSKQFFGNISMRQSSDIDFVINSEDIPKAIEILEKDGFVAYQKKYYNWIGHKKFIQNHKDFSFDKHNEAKRIHHVELHFNIINKNTHLPDKTNTFDTNEKTKCLLFQKEIECLKPVSHFRAIALHHMLMDNMGYLKTVVDITQVLIYIEKMGENEENNSYNQSILDELNKNYNLSLIYQIITDLIGIDFESSKENKTKNSLTERILNSSYRKVRDNKFPLFDALSFNYNQLKYTSYFYIKTRDKISYLFKNLISITYPQPEDFMILKLNKKLYFLYYIIRPFRLLFFPGDPNNKA